MTRRPVLPGASELFFRRTDTPSAANGAPVAELPSLAAAAASPALRGNARRAPGDEPAGDDTGTPGTAPLSLVPAPPADELATLRATTPAAAPQPRGRDRTKHAEKITVYCSGEELLALETARLTLRGEHGVVADRGRIVREAVAVLLADLAAHGDDSVLVRRLRHS